MLLAMQANYFGGVGGFGGPRQQLDFPVTSNLSSGGGGGLRSRANSSATTGGGSGSGDLDDDTNPLFISAVRIFLDFVRDKHGIACPEKTCSLEELIRYLVDFQDEARTKKGERYSPSTIRVIRYSLNRVIALGRNQQEMRPYPTQSTGIRKKRKLDDGGKGELSDFQYSGMDPCGQASSRRTPPTISKSLSVRERCNSFGAHSSDQFAPQLAAYNLMKTNRNHLGQTPTDNTIKSIQHGIDIFRNWLSDQGVSPVFESFPDEQIDDQLVSFVRYGKSRTGKDFTRSSMQTFRVAITQYLKQHGGLDIGNDPVFEPTREAFHQALAPSPSISLERKPLPTNYSAGCSSTEWLGIPVECIKDLYRSGALSVATATTLQRKVWLELTIFFRGIPCCPDQIYWNKNTFKISSGDGVKYVELNPDMYNRYGSTIDRMSQQPGCIMVQRTGSPYCPVSSFEIYLKALDPSCESLFAEPRGKSDMELDYGNRPGFFREAIRYSEHPMTSTQLAAMMENIAHAAKLPYHFTGLSAAETDHVAWMRALTALELELQCQAAQFSFPVVTTSRRDSSRSVASSPESASCHRTSVIQAAPRLSRCDSDPERLSAPVPSSGYQYNDYDVSLPFRSRTSTGMSDFRTHGNLSPEAIDLCWRKKMKLDQFPPSASLRVRSNTDLSVQSQSSSVSVEYRIDPVKAEQDLIPLREEKNILPVSVPQLFAANTIIRPQDPANPVGEDDLTVDDIRHLYATGIFNPDAADTLQNKILFEMNLHFGRVCPYPKKTRMWHNYFFRILKSPEGRRYISLSTAATDCNNSIVIYERPNCRHCPVAAYEKYLSLLPTTTRLLFTKPFPNSNLSKEWYSSEPCDYQEVDTYLAQITEMARFSKTLTQASLNTVTLKNWSVALDRLDTSSGPGSPDSGPQLSGSRSGSESARPTVKRILENYRKSKESSRNETEKSGRVNTAAETSAELEGSALPVVQLKGSALPVIVVRPQIVIVRNSDTAQLDRAELKQMISDALAKAIGSADWDRHIEEAITAAQGSGTSAESSESPLVAPPSSHLQQHAPVSQTHISPFAEAASHSERHYPKYRKAVHRYRPEQFNHRQEDSLSNSSASSAEHVLRIADITEASSGPEVTFTEHERTEDSAAGGSTEETHGSHRRKAFLPIKHSD